MKAVTIQVPNYKTVQNGFKDKTVYESVDGKTYDTPKEARQADENYENLKLFGGIEKKSFNFLFLPGGEDWYFAKTEEELELLKRQMGYHDKRTEKHFWGQPKVGEWFTWIYEDGGDYPGYLRVYTLPVVKKEMQEFLNSFQENAQKATNIKNEEKKL